MIETSSVYLDECVDHRVTPLLRAAGHDTVTALDAGMFSAPDEIQLEYARLHQRILISHNRRDFERLHRQAVERGQSHAGIIIVPAGSTYLVIAMRVRMLLDWLRIVSDRSGHSRHIVHWGQVQYRLTPGERLPGYSESDVRLALGQPP